MVTSQSSAGLAGACLDLLIVSLAAGDGVGGLVHGLLRRALGLFDAPFVLQAPASGQRASGLLHATLRLSMFSSVMNPPDLGWRGAPKWALAVGAAD